MKKVNLLSRAEMKRVLGGGENPGDGGGPVEPVGGGGGGGGGDKFCNYRCCTPEHTDCGPYTASSRSCTSSDDCSGNSHVSCSAGHMFWTCK